MEGEPELGLGLAAELVVHCKQATIPGAAASAAKALSEGVVAL